MLRNIALAKVIFSLYSAWFWLGIWVPYYLLFTNYSGLGILETVVVLCTFLLELPTGAFTDLIGKKSSLLLVFIFFVVGNLVMASAGAFWQLFLAVLLLGIGTSLYSGTRDAFLYDTMVQLKTEHLYEKVLASIQKYSLVAMAVASAIGGWLYTFHPSFPFYAVAVVHGICGLLVLFLKEPPIDSQTFSWQTYVQQMKIGLKQLFQNGSQLKWIWLLLLVTAFTKYLIEGIDPALGLYFGLSEAQLGYLYAVVPLVSAAGAFWYEKHSGKHQTQFWWNLLVAAFFVTAVLSPVVGLGLGVVGILVRNIFYPIIETLSSSTINRTVESKYRATTLSAFAMLASLPYVIGAAFVGMAIDRINAGVVTASLAIGFGAMYFLSQVIFSRNRKKLVVGAGETDGLTS